MTAPGGGGGGGGGGVLCCRGIEHEKKKGGGGGVWGENTDGVCMNKWMNVYYPYLDHI